MSTIWHDTLSTFSAKDVLYHVLVLGVVVGSFIGFVHFIEEIEEEFLCVLLCVDVSEI